MGRGAASEGPEGQGGRGAVGSRLGGGNALVHCLGWGGLGLALTFLLLTLVGLLLTLGLGGLGLAEACPDIPLVHFGGLECYSEC